MVLTLEDFLWGSKRNLVFLICTRKQCDETKIKANGDLFIYFLKQALLVFPKCCLNAIQWELVSILVLLYCTASCSSTQTVEVYFLPKLKANCSL